jgi:predicted ABC-type ATPase
VAEPAARVPSGIFVLAGCNGAGKTSIAGAALRAAGIEFFDPDRAARSIIAANAGRSVSHHDANAHAWDIGRRLLERAIDARQTFALETTLGGTTMTALLAHATDAGIAVHVWFVGLASLAMHVDRVRRRVAKGGHAIPVDMIRRRFVAAPANLVKLMPGLRQLYLYDNSAEGDPDAGVRPSPRLLMQVRDQRIVQPRSLRGLLDRTPQWAKPIVAAGVKAHIARA